MAVKLNGKGKSHAGSLIDAGKVDKTSSWSFSSEDDNKILGDPPDWAAYSQWHLGIDPEADQETKAAYHYPFGKNGKVYRSGLIAIRQRAAQQGATDIYDAAGVLIDKIDGNKAMSWYEIKNHADASEIWIYDEIGYWGIGAKDFILELNAIKSKQISMHINSPGGEVFDGNAIYNAIKNHPASVTTYIDGIAASIASVIALAGDKVIMAENAIYMMHNPFGLVIGNADEMRKMADVLDKICDSMLGAYVSKSGKTQDEIRSLLDAETWMNADEAKEAGFVDEISGKMDMAACVKYSPIMMKLGFKNIPEIIAGKQMPTARDLERILRDGGCSEQMAKSILAEGFKGDQRDVASFTDQRDVAEPKPPKKDRVSDLLTRAEIAAPSQSN
jgi:ATP-dependent Clp endopeptidase proteolytic subunit ClpP